MADKLSTQLFGAFLLFFVLQPFVTKSLELESVQNLKRAQKGDVIDGINQIKKYLKTYGYYQQDNKHTLNGRFDDSLESALKAFQKYLGIGVTGVIDSDTMRAILTPRCGVPDNLVSNYGLPGDTWGKKNLTWRILNSVKRYTENELGRVFAAAFKSWADETPLMFTKVGKSDPSDIDIRFGPKYHGDGQPFKDDEFAHAFYPTIGKAHFYDKWNWTLSKADAVNGIDLPSISVHEFGHALGLDHIDNESAVMYAYFTPGTTKRELTDEDKKAIKALYPN